MPTSTLSGEAERPQVAGAVIEAQFIAVCSSVKPCVIGENLLSVSDRSHDQRRGASMPVLSYVHQIFNAEQCQAYIHTLRWKDRSLQCPRCQSHNVGPWGIYHAQPGLKRYRCKEKGCKRTFND